jgi:hypothetical protein
MEPLSHAEQLAVSAVASLGGKRDRDDCPDAAGGFNLNKVARQEVIPPAAPMGPPPPPAQPARAEADLKPYPFYYYKDFSKKPDPDVLTPLTAPGRVPNFPAKMHSILSNPSFADIVAWMPHGRSWRVLKPREFEVSVIPTYFEHAKFSSFIRQANGWGFRRVTQGRDRNSYYHELFLRGLPHLCKDMKRPGVAEKQAADPEHEPDLHKIAEELPVPDKSDDESILLQCTLQGGPKARMPIYSGALASMQHMTGNFASASTMSAPAAAHQLNPRDQQAMSAFQQSLGASEHQLKNLSFGTAPVAPAQQVQPGSLHNSSLFTNTQGPFMLSSAAVPTGGNKLSTLAAANQLAYSDPTHMAAAFQASSAASQFAAGFAAATALSHQQLRNMLGSMGVPPSEQP